MFNDYPQTSIICQVWVSRFYVLFTVQENAKISLCFKNTYSTNEVNIEFTKKKKVQLFLKYIWSHTCALNTFMEVYWRRPAGVSWFVLISITVSIVVHTNIQQFIIFFLLHTIIFCKQVFTVTMRKREGKKNKSILAVKNSLGFSVEY